MTWEEIVTRDVAYLHQVSMDASFAVEDRVHAAGLVKHFNSYRGRGYSAEDIVKQTLPAVVLWRAAARLRRKASPLDEVLRAMACVIRDETAERCGGDNAVYGYEVNIDELVDRFVVDGAGWLSSEVG